MKKIIIPLNVLVLLTVCVGNALAEPKSGFGFNTGWTSNKMSGVAIPSGTAYSYDSVSTAPGAGLDYQFAISDRLSFNPFLMATREDANGTTLQSGTFLIHSLVGLQFRYWINNMFIGGHVDDYVEDVYPTSSATTASSVGSGLGKGLVVGWENSGGEYIMAQVDAANISNSSSNVNLTGFRISAGWRWKK
jgi:hypothetical protein